MDKKIKYKISKAKPSDSHVLAQIHRQTISSGFLSSFDNNILDIVYKGIINDPDSFVVVAKINKDIVGFVAFTFDSKELYKRILMKNILFFIKTAPKYILQKKSKKILDHLKYGHKKKKIYSELLSICILENHQNKGVGSMLFDSVIDEAVSRGIKMFKIVVGKDLRSNSFFISKKCNLVKEFNFHHDNLSNLYIKEC